VLGNAFGPDDEGNPRVLVDLNGRERVVLPSEGGYSNNAACVGGGTFSYGAQAWRYMEKDFRMRSTYGAPGQHAGRLAHSYDDLEPYYEKAEWEIGVSGDDSGNPSSRLRAAPLPMPPLPPNREYQILQPAAKRLGLHPFDIPCCATACPTTGAALHALPLVRGIRLRVNAKCGTQNTVIPARAGHRQLRTAHRVHGEGDSHRRPRPRHRRGYFDADDRLQEQPADIVIVSGGAIESARLLLNSKSRCFPTASATATTWVGRNLQGHTTPAPSGSSISTPTTTSGRARPSPSAITTTATPACAAAPCWPTSSSACPTSSCRAMLPPGAALGLWSTRSFMRTFYKRTIAVMGPHAGDAHVRRARALDPKVRDHWGIPVARLSGNKHPHTIEIATVHGRKAEAWLKEAGAVQHLVNAGRPNR
jgi:hypothetical protein